MHPAENSYMKAIMLIKESTPVKTKPAARSLRHTLKKSEQIKVNVEECAEELASVNTSLKKEVDSRTPQPTMKKVLKKSEAVEDKVQECADDLETLNLALEDEVLERHVLEHELVLAKKQEEAARQEAFHDSLTHLPNRVLFNDRLEHGLAQAKRHGWTLAVMFIDLDEFKGINDTHGHPAGDEVLQTIAARLKSITRDDDTISRHGGDEFLYLLMELDNEEDAVIVARKIINTVSEPCEITTMHDGTLSLSVKPSIGIAMYPLDGNTVEKLVKSADRAMYLAKKSKCGYAFTSTSN